MAGKSVLVIGGGIAGIQASLDMADKGVKVYLVEREPSIGGRMAQLDKTFPTNDCSICILAPKMADCIAHENIDVMTYSEVQGVHGKAGDFTVKVQRKARYVDESKCTGCGDCIEKCPSKVPSEFDMNLGKRRAIYLPFMQAVPRVCTIDAERCQKLLKDKCGNCEKVCGAEAIDYNDKDEIVELNVGSIIACPGFEGWEPSSAKEYGYGRFPNVYTGLEFERLLSAAGPTTGHTIRRSDGEVPGKIAFIQCVGSRDIRHGNPYCSSVCCMHAVKEAVIAKEHEPAIETHIFFMDVRASGKEFDDYCLRAEKTIGVRFTRNNRISHIEENPTTHNLRVNYIKQGKMVEEEYDMVVLSACIRPPSGVKRLAEVLGIDLNSFGFAAMDSYSSPMNTNREGIYVSGVFGAPKDIPDSVAGSSGAASLASEHICEGGFKFVPKRTYPQEIRVHADDEPRVGVFVCHCGHNIGGFLDVPDAVEYVRTLPYVKHAEHNLYTCAEDGLSAIRNAIDKHALNRIVVASCTPRTHGPLFMNTCREAGLNEYLFEMANIRDQCSWVHMKEPNRATQKAKDLLRMAVAKVVRQKSLNRVSIPVKPSALILGGGVSGMNAALQMSLNGFDTHLIEKEPELGGLMRNVYFELGFEAEKNTIDVQARLAQMIDDVVNDERIHLYLGSTLKELRGFVGNFTSVIDKNGMDEEIEHGVVIVATGGNDYKPSEFMYGKDERVMTQLELEKQLISHGKVQGNTFVMIHCVGCRDEFRPYCSRVCCLESIKNSLKIKELNPGSNIYHIFRDIRTYGFHELHYQEAARKGVLFIRYTEDAPPVVTNSGGLEVRVKEPFLDEQILIRPDVIGLATAAVPANTNEGLAKILKVPLSKDGFFLEAHMKLRPVDFATDGIFLCGLAHSPKFIDDCIVQSSAAVSRACTILARDFVESEGIISQIDEEKCVGCRTCEIVCPFAAIHMEDSETGLKARVVAPACKGCGSCGTACPEEAITMLNYTDDQLISAGIAALWELEGPTAKSHKEVGS